MAPISNPPLLLFTDLDGTLLDHYSYTWEPAREALAAVTARRIPLIFNTSKTFDECRDVQRHIGIGGPVVFENGAGIAVPDDTAPAPVNSERMNGFWLKGMAIPYQDLRGHLINLRQQGGFQFRGFGDMALADIVELTGLPPEAAERAQQRRFGEPLVWQDSDARLVEFGEALQALGLQYTRGGRFVHVMGPVDKGKAMLWLRDLYGEPRPQLVALGDGENDLAMLRLADVAVQVRSPAHELPLLPLDQRPPGYMVTEDCGPSGWNSAVLEIIKELTHG